MRVTYRVRKTFTFEAAHRLDVAESRACVDTVHGHSYTVELFLTATCLNRSQMVLDFGMLSPFIEGVKEEWDHALFVSRKRARDYLETGDKKVVVMPASPTAEVMSYMLLHQLVDYLAEPPSGNGLAVEKVRVHETGSGWAEARVEEEE